MKIIIKSGSSIIEYSEPQESSGNIPELCYNSGTRDSSKYNKNKIIIDTIKTMCELCVEMENKQYDNH